MKRTSLSLLLAAAVGLTTAPAHALLITFGGQTPGDGSGLTSSLINSTNMMPLGSGYFVETFDVSTYTALPLSPSFASANPGYVGIGGAGTSGTTSPSLLGNAGASPGTQTGCSINAYGGPALSTTGGGFAVQRNTTPSTAAAPANNTTCFGFGPQAGGSLPASVKIDYQPILAPGDSINYLGVYYGSIDTYNEILFYSGDNLLRTLTGTEILGSQGGTSGNQFQPGSNVYVNLFFSPAEAFTAFEFRTTGVAFEFDNVVVGLSSRPPVTVPTPPAIALILMGMLGLQFAQRRRRAKRQVA